MSLVHYVCRDTEYIYTQQVFPHITSFFPMSRVHPTYEREEKYVSWLSGSCLFLLKRMHAASGKQSGIHSRVFPIEQ